MKKVMVGILILIPVIILLIVVAVSNFLQMAAWIAVDNIAVLDKSGAEAESVTVIFPSDKPVYSMYDYLDIKVMPDYANRYSIEWRISGDVECMDKEYEKKYKDYLERREAHDTYLSNVGYYNEQIRIANSEIDSAKRALDRRVEEIQADKTLATSQKNRLIAEATEEYNTLKADREAKITAWEAQKSSLVEPELGVEVEPAAMFVDDNNKEVTSNTSGKFIIKSYCRFNVVIQVESVRKTISVVAEGYNVESIELANIGEDDSTLKVGEKMMLEPNYHPMSSIVTKTEWTSTDPSVASVDQNGVVTAHKAGSAQITVKANKYDVDETVTSSAYTVTVEAGASKFGTQFSTSKTQITLDEIGLSASDITGARDGYDINGNLVTLTADVAHIETSKGTVTVNRCGADDIVIENAEYYSAGSGYVFAVGGLTLKLKAVWADALRTDELNGVVWTAKSDGNIASVTSDGEVTATESGLVEIIAEKDGHSASLILNLQIKLVSMKLRTGNDYYKVGLAMETVFAAERYLNASINLEAEPDVVTNNDKEPNSTLIQIIGAPKRTSEDTDGTYQAKLAVFYNAFTYEIVSGGDYAYMDANEPNKVIFKPAGLEGKGKQAVKVRVRAKYPRYASAQSLIQEEVDIKVIYGVEVSSIQEFRVASHDQYTYAHLDGNLQERELIFEHTVTEDHAPEKYEVYNGEYSLRTYGISVVNDVAFEPGEVNDANDIKVFGDVYGNGNRLEADRNQVRSVDAMLWVAWSNITISNLNIRMNKIDKDTTLSAEETNVLTGEAFQIFSPGSWNLWVQGYAPNKPEDYYGHERNRLFNVRMEYGILENGRRIGQAYNADCTLDGLVMRNVVSPAFQSPSRMYMYKNGAGEYITYPDYNRVVMNNCVFSNCLATIGSFVQESFTLLGRGWDDDYYGNSGSKKGDGRFVRGDLVRNGEYFMEHFASKGINAELHQTGFIDIYNWQNIKNAQLIDVGDSESAQAIGELLVSVSGKLLAVNPEFARCRYIDEAENASYVHLGFILSGIDFSSGILNEPIYMVATFDDTRFADPVKSANITETPGAEPIVRAAENLIHSLTIECMCYTGDMTKNNISPYSTFEINDSFINRLHQTA